MKAYIRGVCNGGGGPGACTSSASAPGAAPAAAGTPSPPPGPAPAAPAPAHACPRSHGGSLRLAPAASPAPAAPAVPGRAQHDNAYQQCTSGTKRVAISSYWPRRSADRAQCQGGGMCCNSSGAQSGYQHRYASDSLPCATSGRMTGAVLRARDGAGAPVRSSSARLVHCVM